VLAGLSAGGYGAVDIGLRNPGLFGTVESWSGYFTPLHDGPFAHARKTTLDANTPTRLAAEDAPELRRAGQRYFLSTGRAHSHWFRPSATLAFARKLRTLRIPVTLRTFDGAKGEWRDQLAAGLMWAFGTRPSPA
jgi:enterochelin esterase-like enzyme